MWLENQEFRHLGTAIRKGERGDIDKILSHIFELENFPQPVPAVCPQCNLPLVQKALPYLEIFVKACPNQHGVWMNQQVSAELRHFIRKQMFMKGQSRYRLYSLNRTLLVLFAAFVLIYGPPVLVRYYWNTRNQMLNARISENYWPQRNFNFPAMPLKESVIDHYEDIAYFQNMLALLEEGISNRMNIDAVLQTRRSPEEYAALWNLYQKRQENFLQELKAVSPPGKWRAFHEHLMRATESQIHFYAVFAEAKSYDPKMDLSKMLDHPALKQTNQELWAAYRNFQTLYPHCDSQTNNALETRLCWFDII